MHLMKKILSMFSEIFELNVLQESGCGDRTNRALQRKKERKKENQSGQLSGVL